MSDALEGTMSTQYLKIKRERANELHRQITEAQDLATTEKRDLTEDELTQIRSQGDAYKALCDEIEDLTDYETRAAAVAEMAGKVAGGDGQDAGKRGPSPDAPPPLLPSMAQTEVLHRAVTQRASVRLTTMDPDPDVQVRAVVGTTQTGDTEGELAFTAREPRRLATTAMLPTQRVDWAEGVSFPVFGSADSAGVVAEGGAKPEYDDITPGSARPQTIALWTDFTRQADSLPAFRRRLQAKLAARVAVREDQLLVTRALGTTGVQVYTGAASEPHADSLLAAASLVMASDAAAVPNVAVVNQADVINIFGGSVGTSGETPEEELRLRLHGMTVYPVPTAAIAAGAALVGAWPAVSRLVIGLDPTFVIDAVSGIKNNVITGLLEEALDLAVDEPAGFVSVDYGN